MYWMPSSASVLQRQLEELEILKLPDLLKCGLVWLVQSQRRTGGDNMHSPRSGKPCSMMQVKEGFAELLRIPPKLLRFGLGESAGCKLI